jgi:imidazolonepropionase-like amidohydrolase
MRDAYLAGTKLVGRMHRAGVAIHAGTDTQIAFIVPGIALHRELRILSEEAGLGPEDALAAATTVPGRALPVAQLGRIEPGAPADVVLFRRDPTRDLAALDEIVGVVADGRLYRRADLDAQLERYRAYYGNPVFDRVSKALARRALARIFEETKEE